MTASLEAKIIAKLRQDLASMTAKNRSLMLENTQMRAYVKDAKERMTKSNSDVKAIVNRTATQLTAATKEIADAVAQYLKATLKDDQKAKEVFDDEFAHLFKRIY